MGLDTTRWVCRGNRSEVQVARISNSTLPNIIRKRDLNWVGVGSVEYPGPDPVKVGPDPQQ